MRPDIYNFLVYFKFLLGVVFLALAAPCVGQNPAADSLMQLKQGISVNGSFAAGETQTFALHLESNQLAALVLQRQGATARITIDEAKGGKNVLAAEINAEIFAADRILLASADEPRDLLVKIVTYDKTIAVSDKFSLTLAELKKLEPFDQKRIAGQSALLEAIGYFNESKPGMAEKAITSLENALKIARENGDSTLQIDVLRWLQIVYTSTSDLTKSIEYGNAALVLMKDSKNTYAGLIVRNGIGFSLTEMGEARSGIEILNEILPQSRKFGDRHLETGILNNLSVCYQYLDDFPKALEMTEQALKTAENSGNPFDQIDSLHLLSRIYNKFSEFSKAIEMLNKALQIGETSGIKFDKSGIFNELSTNLISLGQLQKALDYIQMSLENNRRTGSRYSEAVNLTVAANIYMQLGQTERAIEYSRQAVQIFSEYDDKQAIIQQLTITGKIYLALKDNQKAKAYFQDALKIFEKNNIALNPSLIYYFLGTAESQLGNYEAALEYFLKSAEIRGRLKMKQPEAAALDAATDIYIQIGNFDKGAELAAASLEKARATGDRVIESNALYNLARVRRNQKNLKEALTLIENSLKIIESMRAELINQESRTAFLSTARDKYDFYISLLIELQDQPGNNNYGAQAFAASERARARGLLDLLAESYTDVSAGISPELKARERTVEAKISALQTQIIRLKSAENQNQKQIGELQENLKKADDERELLESEIRRTNPRYADLKYSTTIDLAQTQKMLDEKTVLLEYQIGANGSFLFAVGKNDFQIVPLPDEKTLRSAVDTLRRSISTPSRTNLANYLISARGLYQTLVAPLETLLKTKTKLIIAADGALNYLPFEVLLREKQDAGFDKLPYLVRDFEISYTPSASVLANLRSYDTAKMEKAPKSFLAFAAPDYQTKTAESTQPSGQNTRSLLGDDRVWKLTDLQFARTEALGIAKLFPAGQTTVLTGADATEQRVKQPDFLNQYRYLHFAVHGLIDEERPQFSSLVLSLPKSTGEQSKNQNPKSEIEEDGLLQTPEIFNLRLRADLVTLSACETGLGQEMRGEGMVGLTRAFFYAGTPSVLVSLWKVDDASTAELMTLFYENLQKTGGREKSAALRETQLKMIAEKRYAHPYYWASFILQGKANSDF